MRKLGDLMKDLGFNEQAAPGAQEAFLKNLIREAYGVDLPTPTERRQARQESERKKRQGEQLSFDLKDLVPTEELSALQRKHTRRSR